MVVKLLTAAKAAGTDVNSIALLASLVCTFDTDRVGEVAGAGVAFDLQARLAHSCYVIKTEVREKPETGGRKWVARDERLATTYSESPPAGTVSSGA